MCVWQPLVYDAKSLSGDFYYRNKKSVNEDNIEKVKQVMLENRRVGIKEVAEALNISYRST